MTYAAEKWREIEALMPISCVDILPWRRFPDGKARVLLIRRRDQEGALRWNLTGGRIRIDETVANAVKRHIHETLGVGLHWQRQDFRYPDVIGEYLRKVTTGYGFDPRHHAIGLSYSLECDGDVVAAGDARACAYFAVDCLPDPDEIGFSQANIIYQLAEAVKQASQ